MKIKITLALMLCFLAIRTIAQTDKAEISQNINTYFSSLESGKYQQVIDLTYPRLFELMPKIKMLEMMENINKNPDFLVKISDSKIKTISETVVIDNTKYAKIDYSFKMIMYDKTPEKNAEDGKSTFDSQNFTLGLFKKEYGESNVVYYPKENKYEIVVNKQILSVQGTETKQWTFIGIERRLYPMLEKILPKALLNE